MPQEDLTEIGIQLYKNHFLSVLSGVDDSFPIYLWDKLTSQANLTLNLLRKSNATPSVSAHTRLFGNFDHNRMYLYHHWEVLYTSTKMQTIHDHGHHIQWKDGTSEHCLTITGPT